MRRIILLLAVVALLVLSACQTTDVPDEQVPVVDDTVEVPDGDAPVAEPGDLIAPEDVPADDLDVVIDPAEFEV